MFSLQAQVCSPIKHDYMLDDVILGSVMSNFDLGVIFDQTLSFRVYVEKVVIKGFISTKSQPLFAVEWHETN